MLALGADCVLVALARTNGDARRSPSSTPAGAASRTASSRRRRPLGTRLTAIVGPAIGPCCYEVGEEVASRFRAAYGRSIVGNGKLDLWTAAEQAARAAGATRSSASTCARGAAPISSSPNGGPGGRAGRRVSSGLSAEAVRARYERVGEEVGPRVTIVAATKYVSVEDMAVLAEAGIEVVGENRAQDLEAKHAAHGDAFRWHFIGHLQSRKAKVVNELCELVHSLDSESAARLEIPALVQVNLAGEETKSGIAPTTCRASSSCTRTCAGCRRCRPRRRPRRIAAVLPQTARIGRRTRPDRAFDGYEPGLQRRRGGGGRP